MSDHYYSVPRSGGLDLNSILTGTVPTNNDDAELRIRDGVGWDRLSVVLAIDTLIAYFDKADHAPTP